MNRVVLVVALVAVVLAAVYFGLGPSEAMAAGTPKPPPLPAPAPGGVQPPPAPLVVTPAQHVAIATGQVPILKPSAKGEGCIKVWKATVCPGDPGYPKP